ncbi:MAG: hypothetical protein K6B46_05765 [Opitutales bacterium]|nr:hypothetical protein [Opitutales bacterium]
MFYRTLFSLSYRRGNRKRLLWAALAAVVVHFLIWLIAPKTIDVLVTLTPVKRTNLDLIKAVDLPEELLPEVFKKPKFVPVNSEAKSKKPPEETLRVSSADQRAAQENPDINSWRRSPELDGEKEESLTVNDRLLPREFLPPQAEIWRSVYAAGVNPAQEISEEADEAKIAEGIKALVSDTGTVKIGESPKKAPQLIEGVPAPTTQPKVLPAPGLKSLLMKSNTRTNEIGTIAIDARYSEYGEYTQRMLEAIEASWYKLCENKITGARGHVVVRFCLRSDGVISSSSILESTAGEVAAYACRDAIESRAPFEEWSQEMIELLGEEEETVISFHYR